MAKKNYTAQLADGTIINRGTEQTYTHLWVLHYKGRIAEQGFSSSKDLAEKAARAYLPTDLERQYHRGHLGMKKSIMDYIKKQFGGSWENYRADREARLAQCRIEIVPCYEA